MSGAAPRVATVLALATLLLVAGYVDLVATREFNFSIFYTVATAAAAWLLGRGWGIAFGALATLTWSATDYFSFSDAPDSARSLADYLSWSAGNLAAVVWNGVTRLAIFAALAYLVDRVRRNQADLRSLLRQRDDFLTLMAHELRAPVAAIEIVAAGLARTAGLSEAVHRATGQLHRQARALASLAEGVLDMGRLEAGIPYLQQERFDLRTLLDDLTEDTRLRLRLPESPLPVYADPDALRRAIENLLGNAMKFSPVSEPVDVAAGAEDGYALVAVTDRGIGLTEEEASRVFRKYERIHNEATVGIEGVGLGLYLTNLVVVAHSGSLRVSSPGRGRGATFTIRLPLSAEPRRAEAMSSP